jgi:serine/threonine-protein kinase
VTASDRDPLSSVAVAILDGTGVDWASAEATAGRDQAGLLPHLRIISTVADLHRRVPAAATGPTRWGHLELLERIGAGSYGEVYRAWDSRLDREVALKLLAEGTASAGARLTSIVDEGRLLARVRHPNVVTIYGAERLDGRVGLWMEFIRGRTLEELVAEGRAFTPQEVAEIGLELARAIAAVHAAGLLHRDIKAQNVMRADDGRVVLMDFGTGLEQIDSDTAAPAGTPRYLAPELFEGGTPTQASDLYSLGVLLFRLATGAYPVPAEGLAELGRAHAHGTRLRTREAGRDVPRGLARVIDRLLDQAPGQRGASAAAVASALDGLARGRTMPPWTTAALVLAGLGLAGLLAWTAQARTTVIAVAPFSVSGFEADGTLIGDGLAQGTIRHLAGVNRLQIRSPVRSTALADRAGGLRAFGQAVRASYIVDASVARSDRTLHVAVRLVEVSSDRRVWTDEWDGDLGNTFAVFDRITQGVARALRLTVARTPLPYQLDQAAGRLYLTARGLLDERDIQGARRAAALLEEVLRAHPDYPPALAAKANAYGQVSMTYDGMPIADALPILRESALRAIQLDPSLSEAHAVMGLLHTRDFNWAAADEAYRRALALDGTSTHTATSYILWVLTPFERYDDAEDILAAARANDPTSLSIQRELGSLRLYTGRHEDAVALFRAVKEVNPSLPFVRLPSALIWAGQLQEAVSRLEAAGPGAHGYLAHAYARAGRRADAEALIEPTREYPMRHALVHAALGHTDAAFDAIDRMMDTEHHRVPRLIVYPEMASLRDHPRYADLRRRLNLPPAGPNRRR